MSPPMALLGFIAIGGILGLLYGSTRGPRVTTIETRRDDHEAGDPA